MSRRTQAPDPVYRDGRVHVCRTVRFNGLEEAARAMDRVVRALLEPLGARMITVTYEADLGADAWDPFSDLTGGRA